VILKRKSGHLFNRKGGRFPCWIFQPFLLPQKQDDLCSPSLSYLLSLLLFCTSSLSFSPSGCWKRIPDSMLTTASRWHTSDMQQDAVQRGLPALNEEAAREQCLRLGVEDPSLATVKDFLRFYIATSQPRLTEKPTVESINTIAEWFFAGLTRVTGTETDAEQRSEVHNVSPCLCPA
jgi:hypothetical protein